MLKIGALAHRRWLKVIAPKRCAGDVLDRPRIPVVQYGENVVHLGLWVRQLVALAKALRVFDHGLSFGFPVVAVAASSFHDGVDFKCSSGVSLALGLEFGLADWTRRDQ